MSEKQQNQEIADRICREIQWNGQQFRTGECVSLLDGTIVAVAPCLHDAVMALRKADPDPRRGMVFEVAPPVMDIIR
jgi:hypothetical protein